MSPLPTGTVTFLFTDIEGSTKLWEQHPEAMKAALARHDAILRQAIEANGGYVFKTVGDAFCAAFPTAPEALKSALAAQRSVYAEQWDETPIKVRMGLHTGAAQERDDDYFGPTLNRTARLFSAGYGGQTILSLATYELVRDHLPPGAGLRDLGNHRLKDLHRPEHVFQLVVPDLPADFPPLKTLDNHPNNLPIQATPFIGRERELEVVRQRLLRPEVRLLTLTGTGGAGKTRLALQSAADLLDEFPAGVFFIPLAPIGEATLVVSAIASALGVREGAGKPLMNALKDYLHQKQLLLVLDNFEQVASAAPLVSELWAAAPRLKMLVTSREMLRLYGEHNYPVPPLALPDPKHLPALERLRQYEAVQLFIERAQAAKAGFAITNENAPAVAEICARLAGLPLAIELAAARVRLLSPPAILARLSLKLLTGGARDLPARQQTMRAAIGWSYDLLVAAEQTLFRRLAVFVGGCTLEAVEAVCNAENDLPMDILDGLGSLADKSLVEHDEFGNEPRFRMLETLREYALERLEESGEAEALRRRHAQCHLTLAEKADSELRGPRAAARLDWFEMEHDNLRAALAWSLGQATADADIEMGMTLTTLMAGFWNIRGHLSEGREWLAKALALKPKKSASRALVLIWAGYLAYSQGDYASARALYEESLAIERELGDKAGIATSLNNLGLVAKAQGDYASARALHEESLAIWRELGNKAGIAMSLNNLGNVAYAQGDYTSARALHEESLGIKRELGDKAGIAKSLYNLGELAGVTHEPERAAQLFGAAEALRVLINTPITTQERAEYDGAVGAVKAQMDEAAFAAAWEAGRKMTMEEAVAYALESATDG